MQCEECGAKADKNWEFCPKCGETLREQQQDPFSEIFERMGQEISQMNKMIESQMEVFDISPMFKGKRGQQQGSGFSISISASGDRPPEVSVRTFGDVDERAIKQQLSRQLGSEISQPKIREEKKEQPVKIKYETMEEPKAKIEASGKRVIAEMELPGVKTDDIEINELESSVEVKALAGKKAFFKILKKPQGHRITSKSFNKGVLKLEFS